MTNIDEAVETREDIPLKSGSKTSTFSRCNEYFFEGSRFVTTAFVFLTIVITIALLVQIYYGDFQVVPHGSVATDSRECSEIGTSVLKRGGNAIDAAIASTICLAVVNPHTSGLDATISILIYDHKTRQDAISFNFADYIEQNQTIPKLIVNLAQLHRIYGHLPWKDVVRPSADLAIRGFSVSYQFAQSVKKARAKKLFKQVEAGSRLILENLADTLRSVSEISEEDLYKQARSIREIKKIESVKETFRNYNIYYPKSQNIGNTLLSTLKLIEKSNITEEDVNEVPYVFKLANITQDAYNKFNILNQFHQGTISNVAVIDTNDVYVSLVMGMFTPFGSQQMLDFGYILDIKSSMPYSILPLIITDANYICAKRIVLGVNDISVASQIITSWSYGVENSTAAIEYPRFIIDNNNTINLEENRELKFSDPVIIELQKLGQLNTIAEPYTSCNFVEKFGDYLNSHSDSRGGGISSRY